MVLVSTRIERIIIVFYACPFDYTAVAGIFGGWARHSFTITSWLTVVIPTNCPTCKSVCYRCVNKFWWRFCHYFVLDD